MEPEKIPEYISALVDKEVSDLSRKEIEFLQQMVHEKPEFFGEYRMNLATKLCLASHIKSVQCPEQTSNTIRALIDHIHKTNKATL